MHAGQLGISEVALTCKGEGAPNERPANRALAIPVLAHGPLAGEGLAKSMGKACTVPLGGTRHENLPVASGLVTLLGCWPKMHACTGTSWSYAVVVLELLLSPHRYAILKHMVVDHISVT